mmetsp:Transcript_3677/g.5493  ORF Transcript_3677/g.5493 Transcript_3677/m.5493 type:complete len:438 (-) Transcript_3677:37-1350(-)
MDKTALFVDLDVTVDCSLLEMGSYKKPNYLKNEKIRCVSIGTGTFPKHGPVSFSPSPSPSECSTTEASEYSSLNELREEDESVDEQKGNDNNKKSFSPLLKEMSSQIVSKAAGIVEQVIQVERGLESMVERSVEAILENASHGLHFKHRTNGDEILHVEQPSSSFMKVSDLPLMDVNFSCPPLGAKPNANERWVQLTLGSSDIQSAVKALVKAGLGFISSDSLWKADKKTEKILQEMKSRRKFVMDQDGTPQDTAVLMWSGKIQHKILGYDIPVFRASGVIAMSTEDLVNLLLDSSRIHEYNKISQGRTDEIVYMNELRTGGLTKVVRSKSKPPIVSKPLVFVSLIHSRKLVPDDRQGEGYLIVTRGVTLENEKHDPNASEILLNVSLIKKIEGVDEKCEMINMNYVSMPTIPQFLMKNLGYNGAISFFSDLRALCK